MLTMLTTRIIHYIQNDPVRLAILEAVASLALPQGYVAAGFVRNLVWDHLHDKAKPTPLNDVDVIYFDPEDISETVEADYEAKLSHMMPNIKFQVRNQARMHTHNDDPPYTDIIDAMSYWPEKETAIAAQLTPTGNIACVSAFGLDSLFQLQVTHNPTRARHVFEQRVQSKKWLITWPKLTKTDEKRAKN